VPCAPHLHSSVAPGSHLTLFDVLHLDWEVVDHLITHTLGPHTRNITHLFIRRSDQLSIRDFDNLIYHLPALEDILLDSDTGWSETGCAVDLKEDTYFFEYDTSDAKTSQGPVIRRMSMAVYQHSDSMAQVPTWFIRRAYLSSIEDLELQFSLRLYASTWRIALAASLALKDLTLHALHRHFDSMTCEGNEEDFILPSSGHPEFLNAPALTDLCLRNMVCSPSVNWMMTILSSIGPINLIQNIRLNDIKLHIAQSHASKMALWPRLDNILTRRFRHLQHVYMNITWEGEEGDDLPNDTSLRLLMPGLNRKGILELKLHVWIDDL
jgi:hypothetical protein